MKCQLVRRKEECYARGICVCFEPKAVVLPDLNLYESLVYIHIQAISDLTSTLTCCKFLRSLLHNRHKRSISLFLLLLAQSSSGEHSALRPESLGVDPKLRVRSRMVSPRTSRSIKAADRSRPRDSRRSGSSRRPLSLLNNRKHFNIFLGTTHLGLTKLRRT